MTIPHIKRALFLFPTDVMGGAENVTRMLAEAALKSDLFEEVICFVLSQKDHGTLTHLAKDPRTTLIRTGAKSEKTGLIKLFKLLAKHQYDLVFSSHTHTNSAVSLMRGLTVLKTRRLIGRESTMVFERDMGWHGWIVRRLYWFYGKQDIVICQTDRMEQSLRKNTSNRFGDRVQTIPNPINLAAIENGRAIATDAIDLDNREVRRIAWCGRLSPVKSPLRAVDTLAELHKGGATNTHLVMIGDGPMRTEILDYAQSCNLSDHVSLTGRSEAPSSIMQHCDLGLMTSDTEGFPNVILEMLASGVGSVVTTDCAGGLAQIPGVLVASEKTSQALASKIAIQLNEQHRDQRIPAYLQERDPSKFLQKIL